MITDSFYKIGATHKVCQDYATHGNNYAIISDGCSSSPNTEVGSMIATRALDFCLQHYLNKDNDYKALFTLTAGKMKSMADALHLSYNSLDATLGFVIADEDSIKGVLYGDGNFIVKYKNGFVLVVNVEFAENYPDYLSYTLDINRAKQLAKLTSNHKKITKTVYKPDLSEVVCSLSYTVQDVIFVDNFIDSGIDSEVSFACVTSDGLDTFQYQNYSGWTDIKQELILAELLAFKVFTQGFLERRMNLFKKYCKKNIVRHSDDFSMGVVAL